MYSEGLLLEILTAEKKGELWKEMKYYSGVWNSYVWGLSEYFNLNLIYCIN